MLISLCVQIWPSCGWCRLSYSNGDQTVHRLGEFPTFHCLYLYIILISVVYTLLTRLNNDSTIMRSATSYLQWDFCTFPGTDTRLEGPKTFSVSSEMHWQSGVKKLDHFVSRCLPVVNRSSGSLHLLIPENDNNINIHHRQGC